MKGIFHYSIWDIVASDDNNTDSHKIDEISRWACKYCITDSTVAAVYCWVFGYDKQVYKFIKQNK